MQKKEIHIHVRLIENIHVLRVRLAVDTGKSLVSASERSSDMISMVSVRPKRFSNLLKFSLEQPDQDRNSVLLTDPESSLYSITPILTAFVGSDKSGEG